MSWRSRRSAWVVVLGAVVVGCGATKDVTPPIEISPGAAARIAQMDRFRLHDEMRQHMMQRPRVWVEEIPDDEAESVDAGEPVEANHDEVNAGSPEPAPSP